MKLSVKSDYAARAVLGLTRHYPDERGAADGDVAAEQGVPPKYLPQILLELKARGIVRSVRGKEGGYLLARPPGEITLGDVLRAVHGPVFDAAALGDSDCPPELRRAWQKLQQSLEEAAERDHFPAVARRGRREGEDVLHLSRTTPFAATAGLLGSNAAEHFDEAVVDVEPVPAAEQGLALLLDPDVGFLVVAHHKGMHLQDRLVHEAHGIS